MQTNPSELHAPAWVFFTYVSFVTSLVCMVGGIFAMPIDLWMRGFLLLGALMLVQSSITMTKTQRDRHESQRLLTRIEDARTEKLLMEAAR